ncbi:hypothetical protein [Terrimonas pollutisoli]|uniref:hypothetical protein n=1 Tax=Terrimonas pollutisoli TaxID=3034147 RepID=UPI0023EBDB9E|nr:hypothetical protein [Terrimonas sp. H1YJ31]
MERGKHLERNLKKLESVSETDWVSALKMCKRHVITRLRKRTLFGAHTEERLGMEPVDYYVSFAYDAILDGYWEWKDGRTLGQQMVRIAENRIGKEVEKYKVEHNGQFAMAGDDIDEFFYSEDPPPGEPTLVQEAVFSKKITIIEEVVKGDENLEMFWECVKDGMKRDAIAVFMEKQPKQIDKLREKLINKIKSSPHFQLG